MKELRKAAFTIEYDIKFSEIVIDSHFLNLIFLVMIYHITFYIGATKDIKI